MRLIVPTATVIVAFVDFLITFVMLALLMAWNRFLPGWRMLVLPGIVVLAFVASTGPALWITALNVRYRDFRYVIPFIVPFGLHASPVGFSSIVVPEEWRLLYSMNPINLRVWALGAYHGLRRQHLQSYPDEFVFRFSRRRSRHAAFKSLLGIAAASQTQSYMMLISPEAQQ